MRCAYLEDVESLLLFLSGGIYLSILGLEVREFRSQSGLWQLQSGDTTGNYKNTMADFFWGMRKKSFDSNKILELESQQFIFFGNLLNNQTLLYDIARYFSKNEVDLTKLQAID